MIANGYNHQTIQPQPKQPASPEDIKRTNKCVQDLQNQYEYKKIWVHSVETNRLIIRIQDNTNNIYKSITSVHCASLG